MRISTPKEIMDWGYGDGGFAQGMMMSMMYAQQQEQARRQQREQQERIAAQERAARARAEAERERQREAARIKREAEERARREAEARASKARTEINLKFCYNLTGSCKNGTYAGDYSSECKNGQGTFTWSNGEKYTGGWARNLMSGNGTFYWTNGNSFCGTFLKNQINGKGLYSFGSKSSYDGTIIKGKFEGFGIYTDKVGGRRYEGMYKSSKRQGDGVQTFKDGTTLKAVWDNDFPVPNACALITFKDKRVFEGDQWVQTSAVHGIMIYPDGQREEGRCVVNQGVYKYDKLDFKVIEETGIDE